MYKVLGLTYNLKTPNLSIIHWSLKMTH